MKLIEAKPNKKTRNPGNVPSVRIIRQGHFWFSEKACEILNIVPGMDVSLFFDGDKPEDWYISIGGVIPVRKYKNALCFMYASLAKQIRDSLSLTHDKNYTFRIATDPTRIDDRIFHALITTKPL